ncbi:conserved hypothetical protein [Rhodopseudomonas palustris BisB5]|uniref:Uncharacterized protein n=1 Tax=Rhodopseudomonas palustris (strain BisB5) TaxID=316057 RepID=Q132V5_RHOPS|nr:conserved hypothetical protein [Rhodopseudomonas palustris BisB5]
MIFVVPVEPFADESLAGLIVRATARNYHRNAVQTLRAIGVGHEPQSLCTGTPALAAPVARLIGSADASSVARLFHPAIEGRRNLLDFFGEPLRPFYRESERRRVAPSAMKNGAYIRAIWSLRPFSFDPVTKETLIDACPQCRRELRWRLTYGVAFCDYCCREDRFMDMSWDYPGLDLRDFPQPKVEVEDEEALDFATGLIDPLAGRKEAARRLIPEMWAGLSNGDLFEVLMTFVSMMNVERWDEKKTLSRRVGRTADGWDKVTPQLIAVAGRAIIGGKSGFERFGDLMRIEGKDKPRDRRYGKRLQIGPLSLIDPNLTEKAKAILKAATERYFHARRDPDMVPLLHLSRKYRIERTALSRLADSRLIPTETCEDLKKAPVLMSDKALAPLIAERRNALSAGKVGTLIGIHRIHVADLHARGLLDKIDGPALKLLKSDAYYTRSSVDTLIRGTAGRKSGEAAVKAVRLRVALRTLKVTHVPWAAIVAAIVERRLSVIALKAKGPLGDRLAVQDPADLARILDQETEAVERSEWLGNAVVAEILGTNEAAVWRLMQTGMLKQHACAPRYQPFKRSEVDKLARDVVFTPEIVARGSFNTYRAVASWLREREIEPVKELKKAGWRLYSRPQVEQALKERRRTLLARPRRLPPPRPKGVLHGQNSPEGKLADVRERADASRIGHATAAALLGCSIFAVQRLATIGRLNQVGKVTPYARSEVHALARELVFLPEIMSRTGLITVRGTNAWLRKNGMKPTMLLKGGDRLPVFDRAAVEKVLGKPISIGRSYSAETKAGLLAMVDGGSSVHAASKHLGVKYATAKAWVRERRKA